MPEKLLNQDFGIPKSIIEQITATKGDVSVGKTFIDSNGNLSIGSRTFLGRYKECAFCSLKRGEYSYCCIFTENGVFGGGENSTIRKGKYLQARFQQNYNNTDYIEITALVKGDFYVAKGTSGSIVHATAGQRLAFQQDGQNSIAVCAL